jgi:sulfur carrier protein
MITIYLNSEACQVDKIQTLHELLQQHGRLGLGPTTFAVAINNQFIPRSAYKATVLKADDRVDIIVPMQGG